MPDLPTFHRQNEACGDIAHVNKVDDEIEIQLKTPAKKVPEHRDRWRQVVIMRPNWHGRTRNDHRKSGGRSLQGQLFREQFRPGIRTRHLVGGQYGVISHGMFGWLGTEKNGFRRAVEKPGNSPLARRGDDYLRASAINGMELRSLR